MKERIAKLCALLDRCSCFADVGCDHGYCAEYMLKNALCDKAYVTDISEGSLSKAKKRLEAFIQAGTCVAVRCDGLEGVPEDDVDLVLIAGMGGDEIIHILESSYIPRSFVFQPMKNGEKLRSYLLDNACSIEYDGIFTEQRGAEEKFYFVIKGKRYGKSAVYSRAALAFGRDSLGSAELKRYIEKEIDKNLQYLSGGVSPRSKKIIETRLKFLKGVEKI